MADISLPQVIHNVKEKYLLATGDTDTVKYGNIDTKIYDAITSGGGITGGYTVTFKVDGNDYYIASCQQGENITEPPTPTSQTGTFTAWQINGVDVSFPYTPSADVELTAHFATVRTEMELDTAGTELFMKSGNPYATKTNNGTMICGYAVVSSNYFMITVAEENTANACLITMFGSTQPTGTITYDGKTYCYCYKDWTNVININSAFAQVATSYTNHDTLAEQVLDHYFYKD